MWFHRLSAAVLFFGTVISGHAPAAAGSDHFTDTYAGDYEGGSLPPDTFAIQEYLRYAHADGFVDVTGQALPNSHANIFVEYTRLSYVTSLEGHKLAIEADLPFVTLTDVNIPHTNNRVAGGLFDPDVHLTYFFTADKDLQRWLGLTNFFVLPLGRSFDNQRAINVSTARQFTDIPQIGYTEGLGKLLPAFSGVFFDLYANAAFHTGGNSPVMVTNPADAPVPGVLIYDNIVQGPSYDVEAFLRYEPKPFEFVAIGIEKSGGGRQIAINGTFMPTGLPVSILQPNLLLSKDDYLRGHLQFQVPITQEFAIGGDVFHDFSRVGGFKENFGIEIRLTKLFLPTASAN
jgi:hypothetical protein